MADAEDTARSILTALRSAFEPHASADVAAPMAAYMRDQFAFFGIPTPLRRRLEREALAGTATPTEAELAATMRALWTEPERELQYAACDHMRRHAAVAGPGFLPVVRDLITTKSWWDTVDVLAPYGAGSVVLRHRESATVMDEWIESDDMWLARAAIIHQLSFKRATDTDRLFDYCRRRAGDTEFFVRKAIGWALRQHARVDPVAVERFIQATPSLSALSVREATKGIDRARPARGTPST